ncbi:MAG: septum formation initiator family protein [Candidatus Azambacteria bacterium]|nr:septum formation initiator family protein [Candidatus Azambacteria bacterium]
MSRRPAKGIGKKIMVLAFLAVAGVMAYKVGRVSYEKYQITKQISTIDGELKALSAKSGDLNALIKNLNNDAYVEKEARKKLNLQKEGEKAVIIVGGPDTTKKKKESVQSAAEGKESNPRKWFRTLFGK